MLEVRDLHFRHQHSGVDVLKDVTFKADLREVTTILGPNGSGKTTILKCVAGIWKPQKGKVLFDGKDILSFPSNRRAKIMAIVPQDHEPPFPYTVLDVVLMGRVAHVGLFSSPSRQDYLKAEEVTEVVGITHLRDKAYTNISGGERQLVLVARALAQEAPILLLDEPTSHLDFRNQIIVLSRVREIARQKKITVLMTLHDPNLAMSFSDKAILTYEGSIVSNGLPERVITEENLKRVYGIDVAVINFNGTRIISPRINRDD
ncbi:MAG: ABC transporter ATP-binding protein [Thermodesulfobacteriota bacterium]